MLTVMLCGADDTRQVSDAFARVVADFGAEAWSYLSGQIRYRNSASAGWVENSRLTVRTADVCVFVIVADYGAITWTHELDEALDTGTPFVLLCRDDTYGEYRALKRHVDHIDDDDRRNLVSVLTDIESVRQLTVVPYTHDTFAEILRRQLSLLFDVGIRALSAENERRALAVMLDEPERLRPDQLVAIEDLALDDFEDKTLRKRAVVALASRRSASDDTIAGLVASREQGVQRLAIELLPDLYARRPAEVDFLRECVSLANRSDDVGVVRRLIPALFSIGVEAAIVAAELIELNEVGTSRRLADQIELHEQALADTALRQRAAELLERCVEPGREGDWRLRARDLLERLQA